MFFNNKLRKIQKELTEQRSTINAYISELHDQKKRKKIEWCTVHGRECKSSGLLMWEKDTNLRYTFLNARHCNDFFYISLSDVKTMIGKTDEELINDFKTRTGLNNSFAEICVLTDKHTIEAGEPCRFWEMGYVGGKIMILDVTKAPIFKKGKLVGTRSWALNQSSKECEVKALLELFLDTGEAVRLDANNSTSTASYLINKKDNPFNGVFPK